MDESSAILLRCLEGDRKAGDAFVETHSRLVRAAICRTLSRYGGRVPEEDVEDLHNELFRRLWEDDFRRLRQYRGENGASLATWLRALASNLALRHLKGGRRTESLEERPALMAGSRAEGPSPFESMADAEREELFGALLEGLDTRELLIVKLHYYSGLQVKEVAHYLGVTENAVSMNLFRIREKIRKLWDRHE